MPSHLTWRGRKTLNKKMSVKTTAGYTMAGFRLAESSSLIQVESNGSYSLCWGHAKLASLIVVLCPESYIHFLSFGEGKIHGKS